MEPITIQVASDPIVRIATVLTAAILLGAMAFACSQWLSARNARMADIVLTLVAQWESDPIQRGRRALAKHGGAQVLKTLQTIDLKHLGPQALEQSEMELGDNLSYFDLVSVADFLDGLGVLVKHGYLAVGVGYDLFHAPEEHYYAQYKEVIEHPQFGGYFEGFKCLHDIFGAEKNKRSPGTKTKVSV